MNQVDLKIQIDDTKVRLSQHVFVSTTAAQLRALAAWMDAHPEETYATGITCDGVILYVVNAEAVQREVQS